MRPADANETAAAWAQILENGATAGLALSRQGLPILDRTEYADTSGVAKGAYVLAESSTDVPDPVPRFHVRTPPASAAARVSSAARWPAARSSTWM